jgi:bacterioferritin (cytochrome b1)
VSLSITELKNRLKTAQDKFELLRLREDITALMGSPQFQELSQSDKNRVEDLLVEALAKEEQYKGCDPWRTIIGY